MRILASARKHGVADGDMHHAITQAVRHHDLDDGLVMIVGPAVTGALLETGIVTSEKSEPVIAHAMSARAKVL